MKKKKKHKKNFSESNLIFILEIDILQKRRSDSGEISQLLKG